ncbi:META domain-containing protein [uncultured Algibacter sp.]|uniref:META domain-containing protein n=1 Tax=uncultured Algibacter sp. TaxID=298659 RepID=UPI0025F61E1D|nr:META domain-containing protein [uncultured Algibacter sp.]
MKFSLLLLMLLSLKSCGSTNAIMSIQENTMQKLSGLYSVTTLGKNNTLAITPEINFDENTNRVSGFSGCNRFNGSYTITENNITFGPTVSTRMMCGEEANSIEHNMFDVLSQVNSFTLKNNELTLLKDKIVLLIAKQNNDYVIEYTAASRGSYQQININNQTVSIISKRGGSAKAKTCSEADWEKLITLINTIEIEKITELEAPSKRFQFDGAAIARLTIKHKDSTYETNSFDHGNPPKEISVLVKEILSIGENIE